MSVNNENIRTVHISPGGLTGPYAFDFMVASHSAEFQDPGLLVYVDGVLQALTTDYTIDSGSLDNPDGGTITFTSAPPTNAVIVLTRRTDRLQGHVYLTETRFEAKSHEDALDRAALRSRESADAESRSIRLPIWLDAPVDMVLPRLPREGEIVQFDENGQPTLVSAGQALGADAVLGAFHVLDFVGQPVYLSAGGVYTKADASALATVATHVVSWRPDSDNFAVVHAGLVEGLAIPGAAANTLYYADPATPGGLVDTAPVTGFVNPVLRTLSDPTRGWVLTLTPPIAA